MPVLAASGSIMLHDLRYALRSLLKSPGFTAVAVLTLAIGIGANTAIFSAIDTVLLRPLPYPDAGQLVAVWEKTDLFGARFSPPAFANYVSWRTQTSSFAEMGSFEATTTVLEGERSLEEVRAGIVTASLMRTLRVQPELGRLWAEHEDEAGVPPSVILSHRLWQTRFGGDAGIVGRPVNIAGRPFTVLGVMPASFAFPDTRTALWIPMGSQYGAGTWQDRGRHNFFIVARLKPGVALTAAQADLETVAARLEHDFSETNRKLGAFATPLREHVVAGSRTLWLVLFGAVALLLVAACANVANLMLTRMTHRAHDLAVRLALGAGRTQLLRLTLFESGWIAVLGGGLGLLVAQWTIDAIRPLVPSALVGITPPTLDGRVFLFASGAALLTCLALAGVAWVQISRANHLDALKQGRGRTGGGKTARRIRGALVVVQLASSIVLLTGAGLLVRTFERLHAVDVGFRRNEVLLVRLSRPALTQTLPKREQRLAFYQQAVERLQQLPGVTAVGFASSAPLVVKGDMTGILTEIAGPPSGDFLAIAANNRTVTADYLRSLGLALRQGRHFAATDTREAPAVAIINESAARKFWPGIANPVGQRFRRGEATGQPITVVGVIADMKQAGVDAPTTAEFYFPATQGWGTLADLTIRTNGDLRRLGPLVRRELAAIDARIPIMSQLSLGEVVDLEIAPRRVQAVLLGAFATLALIVAALGLYGVLAYAVAQRTREFGVRMALGAKPSDIIVNVLRSAASVVLPGMALGAALALAVGRVMSGVLYGITPHDPLTFAGVIGALLAVALLSALLPALRAAHVSPIEALRTE